MASKVQPRGTVSLFKRLWNDKPELVGSSFMAAIGAVLLAVSVQRYYARDLNNRRYREEYTVIRHDDPKAAKLRKDYLGD